MATFILCLIALALLAGAIERATAGYRSLIRSNRRRHAWPREGHTDHFFRDLKRGYFPEDLQ